MLELGGSSPELHRECGRFVAKAEKIDWIFGVQGDAAAFVEAAIEAGHPRERAQIFREFRGGGGFCGWIYRGATICCC